jgi:hypothetical protein
MTPVTDPALLSQLNAASAPQPVTDPEILRQLNGEASAPTRKPVTDPAVLAQLNGEAPQPELRNYEPTLQDKIARFFMGDGRASPEKAALVEGLVGSRGLGRTGIGIADVVPVTGVPIAADEMQRAVAEGRPGGAALASLGVIAPGVGAPVAAAAKAAAPVVLDAAAEAAQSLPRAVAGSDMAQGLADWLKEVPLPFVQNPIRKSAEKTASGIVSEGEQVASAYAGGINPKEAADKGISDWLFARSEPDKAVPNAGDIPAPQTANPAVRPNLGQETPNRIITPDQSMEIGAKPELVELSDLNLASGKFQPRDRSRVEYAQEARERASRLDPAQLQPGRVSDSGAPIILQDGTIISGNGRAMSIGEVYSNPALRAQADAYRASLGPDAAKMRQPVMVMRADAMTPEEAAKFADLSNRGRIAAMSATERAARDAAAIGLDDVALYKGGDFDSPANADFLRSFTSKAVGAQERAAFSKDGKLTMEGAARMRGAVLASAYDDAATLSKMLESTDDNIRNLTGALQDAAPGFASLKADVKAGTVMAEMDAAGDITNAVKLIADLRAKGTTPERHFAQMDAFDTTDPITKEWVKAFYAEDLSRPLSRQKMAEVLNAYTTEARKHAPGGLFEDTTKAADVLGVAKKAGQNGRASEGAGTAELNLGSEVAGNGPRNAQGGVEARGPASDEISASPVRSGEPAGVGITGQAGDGRAQQAAGDQLKPVMTAAQSQEAVIRSLTDARKSALARAIGKPTEALSPPEVVHRLVQMAQSTRAEDVNGLIKARELLGDEVFGNVGSVVVTGLVIDPVRFVKLFDGMTENGKNIMFGGAGRETLKRNLEVIVEKTRHLPRLDQLSQSALEQVPYLGRIMRSPLLTGAQVMFHPTTALLSLTPQLGAYGIARMLAKPSGGKSITRWVSALADAAKVPNKESALALSLAARNLAHEISNETGEDERALSIKLGGK